MVVAVEILGDADVDEVFAALQAIALEHALVVLWGQSGMLFNFSGEPLDVTEPMTVVNSLGTRSWCIAEDTIHHAFYDAIRGPDPFVAIESSRPTPGSEFGAVIAFWVDGEGTVQAGKFDADWFTQTQVDSVDEAVHLLLQWADRSPTVFNREWVETPPHPLHIMDLRNRLELDTWEDPRAVFRQPAGVTARRFDRRPSSLTYGRNREGQLFARSRDLHFDDKIKYFDSETEVLACLQDFRYGEFSPSEKDGWVPGFPSGGVNVVPVTAMTLPDRDRSWSGDSIRAFHAWPELSFEEPDAVMESFIDALGERVGVDLMLVEQAPAPRRVTTILLPVDTLGHLLEKILHLAGGRGVSLVVDGRFVLYNPGMPGSGKPQPRLKVFQEYQILQQFDGSETTLIGEALAQVNGVTRLLIEESTLVGVAERHELHFHSDPENPSNVNVIFTSPEGIHKLSNVPTMSAYFVFQRFAEDPSQLVDGIKWEWSRSTVEDRDSNTFEYGDSYGNSRTLDDEVIQFVREESLAAPGTWIHLSDPAVPGDYSQVDMLDDATFLVEWGHDLGEIECFQAKFDHRDDAIARWLEFTTMDRDDYARLDWQRRLE